MDPGIAFCQHWVHVILLFMTISTHQYTWYLFSEDIWRGAQTQNRPPKVLLPEGLSFWVVNNVDLVVICRSRKIYRWAVSAAVTNCRRVSNHLDGIDGIRGLDVSSDKISEHGLVFSVQSKSTRTKKPYRTISIENG